MDAEKFMKEAKRMCRNEGCATCPLSGYLCEDPEASISDIVSAVEQWSKEHPLVTNGMKAEELIPANNRTTRFLDGTNGSLVQILVDRKWWDAEYKGE